MILDSPSSHLKAAVWIVAGGSVLSILHGLSFLLFPEGSSVRPMLGALIQMIVVFMALIGGLYCLARGWRGGPLWLRLSVLLLSFASYPLFWTAFNYALSAKGITLSP